MNITARNITELLKLAGQELIRISNELEEQKELVKAANLVDPLEKRGYVFQGNTLAEKAASLMARPDFKQLAFWAESMPTSYRGLGEVSEAPIRSTLDSLDRVLLENS